jgi:uncharacterized protein
MKHDYSLSEHHLFNMFGRDILFNVDTMLFYEVTPLLRDLLGALSDKDNQDPVKSLKRKYRKTEIDNALLYLLNEGFINEGLSPGKRPRLKKRRGIRHLELMVTHGCNMGCRYCYGAAGSGEWKDAPYLYGAGKQGMPFATARKGVDFLFEASGDQKELSVVFFGGEPLLEFGLIEKIVPYIKERERETGKNVNLSLSTNGLLLSERVVDFLVRHKIGCQVSIDGPPDIHDKNRSLPDGKGSYDLVMPGIRRLISARRGRVPARATVSHGHVDLPGVVEHLLSLGFGSVHVAPVIGKDGGLSLTKEEVATIKKGNEALAQFLVKNLRNNRYFNYSNLVRFIRQTRVIRDRLAHYCGAGRTYFALSQDGAFYPCHRFVGMEGFRMGDLTEGIDLSLQKKILDLTVDNRPGCRECWARYLCGGGCWKHAVDINGCLEVPDNELSCEITRHEIECAMAINSELKVSDREILSELYEEVTEPYLVTEKGG